jgi:broad specificity phosphatase PhoE
MEETVQIWLARHGATEWSKSGQHTGRTDIPLIAQGEEEARALGRRIGDHPFGRVLCSPLGRAQETARLAGFGDRIELTDLMKEVDYGDYEGVTTKDIQKERPDWELFLDGTPGGETPQQVADRVDRLLADIGEPDDDVLCFAHGHILRSLAARYLGEPLGLARFLKLDAGSLSILGQEHEHPAIVLWNEVMGP